MRTSVGPVAMVLGASLLVGCAAADGGGTDTSADGGAAVDAARGRELYANNCAQCHGPAAEGTAMGPSFLSDIYVPSHHADESFHVAVARGVQPHHWDFGPMPMIPGLDREDVDDIVAHVRGLQREAGLIE